VGRGHHRPAGPVVLAGRDVRVIVREERLRPGAQLRFTGIGGHRFTAFATDLRKGQLAHLGSCATAGAPGARTGSAARRTPGCGTSP